MKTNNIHASNGRGLISPCFDDERSRTPPPSSPPPLKRLCKRSDSPPVSSPTPSVPPCATIAPRSRPLIEPQVQLDCYKDLDIVEVFYIVHLHIFDMSCTYTQIFLQYFYLQYQLLTCTLYFQPKIELPEYGSDDDCSPKQEANTLPSGFLSLDSGMEVLPSYPSSYQGN